MADGVPVATAGEGLLAAERLRRRADYLRCYQQGRRRHGLFAVLHITANQAGHARLGITASRKLGSSVVRHRLKRRVREIYRRWSERSRLPAWDVVVHLKPAAARASFPELGAELRRLLASGLPPPR